MADAKITELTEDASPTSTDLLVTVEDPSGTPITKKATIANVVGSTGAVVDADFSAGEGFLRKVSAGTYQAIKSNLASGSDPTTSDDTNAGYAVGSSWVNTTADRSFVCVDASAGAAVWAKTGDAVAPAAAEQDLPVAEKGQCLRWVDGAVTRYDSTDATSEVQNGAKLVEAIGAMAADGETLIVGPGKYETQEWTHTLNQCRVIIDADSITRKATTDSTHMLKVDGNDNVFELRRCIIDNNRDNNLSTYATSTNEHNGILVSGNRNRITGGEVRNVGYLGYALEFDPDSGFGHVVSGLTIRDCHVGIRYRGQSAKLENINIINPSPSMYTEVADTPSLPGSPVAWQAAFQVDERKWKIYNGSSWVDVTTAVRFMDSDAGTVDTEILTIEGGHWEDQYNAVVVTDFGNNTICRNLVVRDLVVERAYVPSNLATSSWKFDYVENAVFENVQIRDVGQLSMIANASKWAAAHEGATHATILTDSSANWRANSLIGETLENTTDGSTGTVTANTATTVTVDALTGGGSDNFTASDAVTITRRASLILDHCQFSDSIDFAGYQFRDVQIVNNSIIGYADRAVRQQCLEQTNIDYLLVDRSTLMGGSVRAIDIFQDEAANVWIVRHSNLKMNSASAGYAVVGITNLVKFAWYNNTIDNTGTGAIHVSNNSNDRLVASSYGDNPETMLFDETLGTPGSGTASDIHPDPTAGTPLFSITGQRGMRIYNRDYPDTSWTFAWWDWNDATTNWVGVNPAAGSVTKVGTPVDSQVGVWTGDGTIEGTTEFTFDGGAAEALLTAADTGSNPIIMADRTDGRHAQLYAGSSNAGAYFDDAGQFVFWAQPTGNKGTTAGAVEAFRIATVASAVNEVQITNAATANRPAIAVTGSDTNAGLTISAKGTGNIKVGNYDFDADQTVGAGQDNFVLTYDNGTGLVSLESAAGGGNMTADGTPVDAQVGVWTSATNMEGDADLTFDTTTNTLAVAPAAGTSIVSVGGVNILVDSPRGTMTLSNIDALDATTEATIEAAIDTLANLTAAAALVTVGTLTTGNADAIVSAASDTTAGKVEIATAAETNTGTDATRAVSPDGLAGSVHGEKSICIVSVESDTAVATGNGTIGFTVPAQLNGMDLVNVVCSVHDKGITGTTTVVVRRRRAGADADMTSTGVTLGDEFFATDEVIDTAQDDVLTGDQIYIDVDTIHSGTAPNGLSTVLTFRTP